MGRHIAVAALTLLGPRLVAALDSAILQLQVIEGEGAIHPAGSKASRPVTVQVTDETGRPVQGVAVSFRLPDTDVTGSFKSGMKTDVVVTDREGRASAWGIQWGRFPGPARVRVTAAREQARAGTVVNLFIAEGAKAKASPGSRGRPSTRWKWVAVAGGAAAAGASAAVFGGKSAPAPAAVALTGPRIVIGAPSITVTQP